MENRFKNFTVLLNSINRSIRRIKADEMKDFNLKSPHVSCLYYLYQEQSLTAKELTDICDEDKAAISRSLVYLEENGYITCNSQTKKRYKSNLYLTDKGKKVGEYISKKIDALLEIASGGLTDHDREVLYYSLNLISDNLKKINGGE